MTQRNTMIGHTVLWHPEADRDVGPRPALVTGPEFAHPDGLLHMTVFREHATSLATQRNVRHIDDPVLETHPRMKIPGGWDFVKKRKPLAQKPEPAGAKH